ncbi:MAG: sporulation protein YunB [Sporolactobacillus sp.]
MFKPSRRYRRRTMPFRRVFFLTLILFIVFTSFGIWMVNEQMKPAVLAIALTQAEQLGNYAVNYGIGEDVLTNLPKKDDPNEIPKLNYDKLIITHKNSKNEVSDYTLNSDEANHVKGIISDRILWFLRSTEKGQISMSNGPMDDLEYHPHPHGEAVIADIPLGQILNNALLSNYGPRVPVAMEVVSNVQADLHESYKNVGINTIVMMIYLDVKVKVDVIVPFTMKSKTITQHISLGSKVLPLNVPYYYSTNGGGLTPSVPIETPKTKTSK